MYFIYMIVSKKYLVNICQGQANILLAIYLYLFLGNENPLLVLLIIRGNNYQLFKFKNVFNLKELPVWCNCLLMLPSITDRSRMLVAPPSMHSRY